MVTAQHKASPPAHAQASQLMWGFIPTQAVHVAAKLALFDLLRDGPKTPRDLAEASACQELPLLRMRRGGFRRRRKATYYDRIIRSRSAPWRSCTASRSEAAVFNAAMVSVSNLDVPAILEAYDFSGFGNIVDVGGGHGMMLRTILERYPELRGILCDLPPVLAGAAAIRDSGVAARCEIIGADFFESVPAGGNAYLLKRILHDWNDDQAVRICKTAVAPWLPGRRYWSWTRNERPPSSKSFMAGRA